MSIVQADVWNVRTFVLMIRETAQMGHHEAKRTDAGSRGGCPCSTDEAFVMKVEGRSGNYPVFKERKTNF